MANKKVNEFPAYSTPAAGSDILYAKQGLTEKKVTIDQLRGEVASVDNVYSATGANIILLAPVGKTVAPTEYSEGLLVLFKAAADNTGAVTFNVNSLGTRNVTYQGSAVPAGMIKSGQYVEARYSTIGPVFEIINVSPFVNVTGQVTADHNELNKLDGVTATTAEFNKLSGVTATTAEFNKLSGVTATTAEFNKLSGVTATTAELNYVDVTTPGVVEASKAVVVDSNRDVSNLRNISGNGDINITGAIYISNTSPIIKLNDTDGQDDFWIHANDNTFYVLSDRDDSGAWEAPHPLTLINSTSTALVYGNTVWHSGNDGQGSGLDADKLNGLFPESTSIANSIARRDTGGELYAKHFGAANTAQSAIAVSGYSSHSIFNGNVFTAHVSRTADAAFSMFTAYSNWAGTQDVEFNLRGDGTGFCDLAWTGGGADYAEYFEWLDGNPQNEDRVGLSVYIENGKIREATVGEVPFGVVSGNPSVVGDAAWNAWTDKFLRDDFGRFITEVISVWKWTVEEENADGTSTSVECSTFIESEAPAHAEKEFITQRVLNPLFNPDVEYIPRENRKEWSTVGLMGKLRIRKGQIINPNWIKLRDISESVEEWLVK